MLAQLPSGITGHVYHGRKLKATIRGSMFLPIAILDIKQ
jgi:hypothetical protein